MRTSASQLGRTFFFGVFVAGLSAFGLNAQELTPDYKTIVKRAVETHILPGFTKLAEQASYLHASVANCGKDEAPLRAAYHEAFDAWIAVSHLRLGPTEENNAAFALAYWPDPKGHTQKALGSLWRNRDAVVDNPATFGEVSIAARGFFALERLLFDETFADPADGYRCRLIAAVTKDISTLSNDIDKGWNETFAAELISAGNQTRYATHKEAVQALYSLFETGAEFTMTARLRRPIGSEGKAKPKRAEAWRSDRSNRNLQLSLIALEIMFEDVFAPQMPEQAAIIVRGEFYTIRRLADTLPAPIIDMVADPDDRRRVIHLAFAYEELLRRFDGLVRPSLGLSLTFNALDGD